ncbi:MAG: hypothetical protein IKX77_00150 [Clostridia bacterium]|nr:hypothetical protein [Clostridia bacterium]
MSKSIYSLVLSDEVVSQIDRLTYRKGVSRSALIDSLLAREVSYTTPEMRIRQIFDQLESGLSDEIFMPMPSGGSAFAVRSALDYKYNPSLRYSVELEREYGEDGHIGTLSVWLRSRSGTLVSLLIDFFGLWCEAESRFRPGVSYNVGGDGKIVRDLRLTLPVDPELSYGQLGKSLSVYVSCLNSAVSAFFGATTENRRAAVEKECEKYYLSGHAAF